MERHARLTPSDGKHSLQFRPKRWMSVIIVFAEKAQFSGEKCCDARF